MDDETKDIQDNAATPNDQHNAISADLIRGHINTIILRTLYERDKYGYEIIDEIENKSHGQYTMKQPTLYSALKRLESQGYITAYWKTNEVSQGGRRKYFTLTDSGREMAEKNQAEWEYSRTVIDSLISERNFDFTQPAPTAVDFKILKNSTSRVPVVKYNEAEDEDDDDEEPLNEPVEDIDAESDTASEEYRNIITEGASIINEEPVPEPIPINETIAADAQPAEPVPTQPSRIEEAEEEAEIMQEPASQPMSEEQRRQVHENYLKLISEPVRKSDEVPETPYADDIDTNKLIYNNRPEPERDYKNLVNSLFIKTIQSSPVENEVQPVYQNSDYTAQSAPAPSPAPVTVNAAFDYAGAKANDDGLTVNTSNFTVSNSTKKRFNVSKVLLKCSLIIFAVLMIEFALSLIFKDNLGVTIAYPLVILAIACVQLIIFGILRYIDFGKSARKPTSLTYITVSSVFAVLAILIIIVVSLLLNIDFSSAGDIMAKIVLPCIITLNIPFFATLFYVFSKS